MTRKGCMEYQTIRVSGGIRTSPDILIPDTLIPFHVPRVTYIYGDQKREIEAEDGQTILQIALDNGIPMESACGGNGFCTTCMCRVQAGMENLSPRNEREENMGVTEDPNRLSCQSEVRGDVMVEVLE